VATEPPRQNLGRSKGAGRQARPKFEVADRSISEYDPRLLILPRLLNVIEHEKLHWTFRGLQLQSKLILNRCIQRRQRVHIVSTPFAQSDSCRIAAGDVHEVTDSIRWCFAILLLMLPKLAPTFVLLGLPRIKVLLAF
jgi:hypothetical protein